MSFTLNKPTSGSSREEIYESLLLGVPHLLDPSVGVTANLANFCAALKESFDFLWVGFYLVQGEELILAPFQGPIACTRIARGRGVCGSAWEQQQTIVVENVEEFPGHIACSSLSVSEIVVPIFLGTEVVGVLDIDSTTVADFTELDARYLEQLVSQLSVLWEA